LVESHDPMEAPGGRRVGSASSGKLGSWK
jgi:hypothetical protein